MRIRKKLADILTEHMPEDTILLSASRSEGRRMLAECARERLLVGVHSETPLSLAMELCSPLLSGANGWHLMDENEAAELILECLNDPSNTGFFSGAQAKTPAAARTLYTLFQELDLACVTLQAESEKTQQLQTLRDAYQSRKTALRLLDRCDLYRKALEQPDAGVPSLLRARYVALGSYVPKPLERRLIDRLAGTDRLTVVPMGRPKNTSTPRSALEQHGEETDPTAGLSGRCRFFRCRGTAAEVRFVFRDILENGYSAEDCAVVCLSGEYGPLLWETAGRFGIPVTISGGLPMSGSLLYHALEQTAALPEQEFSAEAVCALLEQRAWYLKQDASGLIRQIRKAGIGWGDRTRYEPATYFADPAKAPEQTVLDCWRRFLDLLFAVAAPGTKPLAEQRQDLSQFLTAYANRTLPGEAAAYAKALELLNTVSSLSPRETLLQRVIHMLACASYSSSGAAPGCVFCLPMAQALCTGRKHLYVVGLSRYAIQGGSTSVLLPDSERKNYDTLETTASREQENLFRFWQMVSQHEGTFTFTYPDFDSSRMLDLLPAPVFETLRAAAGVAQPQVVSLLPGNKLTAGDHLCDGGEISFLPPDGTWDTAAEPAVLERGKTLREQLTGFVYSPSSLEMALRCPFQFYLQKLLHLYVEQPPRRREDRWLEKNTMGTLCHEVLEHFYGDSPAPSDLDTPAGQERLEQIFNTSWQAVVQNNPPSRKELMDADRENARRMIETAIRWTAEEQRTVLCSEQKFGTSGDQNAPAGLKLTVDGKNLLLSGSIDRMDRLHNGDYAILDYKTGSVQKMEREKELHLQDFLYSLAQSTLSNGKYIPKEAGYLMLESEAYYISGDRSRDRETEQTIRALLEWMEEEENAQQAAPAFRLQADGTIATGSEDSRRQIYGVCSRYCTMKALCPWNKEEVDEDDQ